MAVNKSGLTVEQEAIARRASNLENKEYIKKIEDAMDDGKHVEVVVSENTRLGKYEFYVEEK